MKSSKFTIYFTIIIALSFLLNKALDVYQLTKQTKKVMENGHWKIIFDEKTGITECPK